MVQVVIIGAATAMLILWLKPLKPEYAVFISLAGVVLIFSMTLALINPVITFVEEIINKTGIDAAYFKILLKIMGLAWICQLASDICKESGCQTIGKQIDIYGKLVILTVSMPIVQALVETINTLFGTLK